ncbi:hypothetical protein NQZ68_005650 [Dissostichus eleginoides]|nr:hypothetical protein NQZ68_005650 [Dissostichus eleginoides]
MIRPVWTQRTLTRFVMPSLPKEFYLVITARRCEILETVCGNFLPNVPASGVIISLPVPLLKLRSRKLRTLTLPGSPGYPLLNEFKAEMRRVFDHPVRGRHVSQRLFSLRQGSQSVDEYAIDFHIVSGE